MEINDTQLNISAVHLSPCLPYIPCLFFLFLSVFDNILRGFALQGGAQGEDHALKSFSQRKDKLCISCDISRGLRPIPSNQYAGLRFPTVAFLRSPFSHQYSLGWLFSSCRPIQRLICPAFGTANAWWLIQTLFWTAPHQFRYGDGQQPDQLMGGDKRKETEEVNGHIFCIIFYFYKRRS